MGRYSTKQKQQLDKIQNEAVRIVTRCSKLISLDDLQKESSWETLAYRRYKQFVLLNVSWPGTSLFDFFNSIPC